MCTVTFCPTARGFYLGMNRDEQRTRELALEPKVYRGASQQLLYPREPNGGTWVGVNSEGLVLSLLNWSSAPHHPIHAEVSRGTIIPLLLAEAGRTSLCLSVNQLPLSQFNPFRLVAVTTQSREISEWAWDGRDMKEERWPWKTNHWFSSGYLEKEVQVIRAGVATLADQENPVGTLPWLRRFHRSHQPAQGPFSICMHRDDARTVSYTEILIEGGIATMNYCPDSPCVDAHFSQHQISLTTCP